MYEYCIYNCIAICIPESLENIFEWMKDVSNTFYPVNLVLKNNLIRSLNVWIIETGRLLSFGTKLFFA